ncbi:MAG: ribonuclease E activity regulator RraA [Methylococcaceae bacterium]|nr:ribonuclease E activity regulator RraA [Methylococcaceae bacterium]
MNLTTAYLCDNYSSNENFYIAEPLFRSFGGIQIFNGAITTLRCFEDNLMIQKIVSEPGTDRVLVVDGGGSHRSAMIGAELAKTAFENGWQGLIIYGCVRDTVLLAQIPIGIMALHAHPLLCHSKDGGDRDILITIAGANFRKYHYVYADADGIIVSDALLS